jgi:hypothetical protein
MSITRRTNINLERVAGIEPASLAWKAKVLPLNYTRKLDLKLILNMVEGEGFEPSKLACQIYSLIPLATREPLQNEAAYSFNANPVSSFSSIKT